MLDCLRKQVTRYFLEFQRINTVALPRSFLRILSVSVEVLFNFDHKQWRVRGSRSTTPSLIALRNYNKISNGRWRIIIMKSKTYIRCFKSLTYIFLLNICTFLLCCFTYSGTGKAVFVNVLVKKATCKIYDFEYVTYTHTRFVRACNVYTVI